jgi:ferritin-like metal-binding protein YciE
VEHYEIATYGCLRTWAELLGDERMAKTLQTTLDEEAAADASLTRVALAIDQMEMNDEEAEEVGAARKGTRRNGSSRSSR